MRKLKLGAAEVSPTVTSVFATMLIIAAMAGLMARHRSLRQSYHFGIATWSRWLPVAATGIFLAVAVVNLAQDGKGASPLGLTSWFSTMEIVAFFLVGPLFLTRLGNILATAALAYCCARLIHEPSALEAASSLGLYLMISSATLVALLADKMPWNAQGGPGPFAHRFREILFTVLTLGAIVAIFVCMVRIGPFNRWVGQVFSIAVPRALAMALLAALLVGWLAIAMGYARAIVLPMLSLPTLFVIAHVTEWSAAMLLIPFAACAAFSLAAADRRQVLRRRSGGFAKAVIVTPR